MEHHQTTPPGNYIVTPLFILPLPSLPVKFLTNEIVLRQHNFCLVHAVAGIYK